MKTIADFVKLDNWEKLNLLELQLAAQLNAETWVQCADPGCNYWYRGFSGGEVVKVEEDGVEYDEEFSTADCDGNASSFYYDDLNKILYIHTSGSDDPATIVSDLPKYSIIAYFWKGFANRPKTVERFDQLLVNHIFNFWTTATNAEEWIEFTAGGGSTVTRDTAVYDDVIHLYSCKITTDGVPTQVYILQDLITKPRRKCKVKILYKTNAGKTGRLTIRDSTSTDYLNASLNWQAGWASCLTLAASTSWTWIEIEFVSHDTYSDYHIIIDSADVNAEIWVQEADFYRYRQPVYYAPLLPPKIPVITQAVGTYVFPQTLISIGEAVINNDGWFEDLKPSDKYLWHNKRMIWRCGDNSWDYEDMPIFFYGLMRKPRESDGEVHLNSYDDRREFKTIPTDRFGGAPVEEDWRQKPIPSYLGDAPTANLIKPPNIDTTGNGKYKMSQATFNGVNYGIFAIDEVRKAGALLATPADYAVDLVNGEFTLTAPHGGAEITCRGRGIVSSQFGDAFTSNPADILYFYLVIMNGVDKHRLNMAALKDLFDNRVLYLHEYLTGENHTQDLINRLQDTSIFQFFSRLDGTLEARRYRADVPDDVLRLYTEDFIEYERVWDTNHTYKELVLKNKYNYISGIWNDIHTPTVGAPPFDSDKIEWEHAIKSRRTIETIHATDAIASTVWINLMSIMEDPIEILKGTVKNNGALMLNPTDKIKVSLERNFDGTEKTIYDDETFQIYHLEKNLNTGNTYFEAFIGWGALFWIFS